MSLPYNTHSICGICYRHIAATVHAEGDKVYITKKCALHGESTHLVENDLNFFKSLKKIYLPEYYWHLVLIEVTDRCNLNCPHCYHIPDNRSIDKPIESIVEQVKNIESNIIMFAGAEPTLRKDLIELIDAVRKQDKFVHILTNGIELSDVQFVKNLKKSGLISVAIGLNHPEYQGEKVHHKQLSGILNCYHNDLQISYIGYTLENQEQLEYVLQEIQQFHDMTHHVRIRFGSKIGRVPNEPLRTLSDNYKDLVNIATKIGYEVQRIDGDDNIYHMMLLVGKTKVRLIQWPDVDNIVLDELATGPWCNFYDGPITNFVHQVITRDAYKNMKLRIHDKCPEKYHYADQSKMYNITIQER